jgi:hypothetical protein
MAREVFQRTLAQQVEQVQHFSHRMLERLSRCNFKRFICLGIGPFTSDRRAQWQLAWSVAARQRLLENAAVTEMAECVLIEPNLNTDEVQLASELGFQVFRGRRNIPIRCHRCHSAEEDDRSHPGSDHRPQSKLSHSTAFHDWVRPPTGLSDAVDDRVGKTLIFMPHCGIGLVELILQLYGEPQFLSQLHLVTNDLYELADMQYGTSACCTKASPQSSGCHARSLSSVAMKTYADSEGVLVDGFVAAPYLFRLVAERCIRWLAALDSAGCWDPGLRSAAFHGLGWQCFDQVNAGWQEITRWTRQNVDDVLKWALDTHYIPI